MKLVSLLITYFFFTQFSFCQEISTNEYEIKKTLSDFGLKGKVKSVISTATDNKGKTITLPYQEHEYFNQISLEFNSAGNLIKKRNYLDYRGKLGIYSYVDYSYNSFHSLESITNTIINNGEDPKRIASDKLYIYNSNKALAKLKERVKGKTSTTNYETDFVYKDNRIDRILTRLGNVINSENRLTYNNKGSLVMDETVYFDGKKGKKIFYIYNNRIPVFKEEIVANSRFITFFDEGNPSKIQLFDFNNHLKHETVFNKNNDIISFKHQSFVNGKPALRTYSASYLYDDKGNWILAKIASSDNQLKYQLSREIIYY